MQRVSNSYQQTEPSPQTGTKVSLANTKAHLDPSPSFQQKAKLSCFIQKPVINLSDKLWNDQVLQH